MAKDIIARVASRYLLQQPEVLAVPEAVDPGVMRRLLGCPVARAAVMTRAEAYYNAGCPLDLCETAAARDIWQTITDTLTHE